jgi:adenylate cyclase
VAATRRLAAVVFTDIVDYTSFAHSDERGALGLLEEQERLVRPLLEAHRGRKVKSMGDGLLIEFHNALDAIEYAVDLQRHVNERNAGAGERPFRLRVGIHLGDVQGKGTDILGDAVNIASRVEPLADPGGVCLSEPVYVEVRNKVPYRLEKLGPKSLKGVREPMEIYRVVLPWGGEEAPSRSPSSHPRLAVLPLANISPDPKDEYFADGLTEELISVLSQIQGLRVISRTSVNQYRGTTKSVGQIGSELGADSVLEGSVRKAGDQLRISVQLIDSRTDEHRWAQTYDRRLDNVFAIQAEIAEKTAGALRLELLRPARESIRKEPTTNLTAYNLYLKGLHALHQSDQIEGFTEARKAFEASIREDPNFAQAYCQLANIYMGLAGITLPGPEAYPRAQELISKALELDPNSSEVHSALGNLAMQTAHDWALAEREFRLAISLNPSNVLARGWYGTFLWVINRFDELIEQDRTVGELDPLIERLGDHLTWHYYLNGDLPSALASAEARRDSRPREPLAHIRLGFLYTIAGRLEEARKEAELAAGPANPGDRQDRALLWCMLGKPQEARELLAEFLEAARTRYVSPGGIAVLYAALGEKEEALEWFDRDHQTGDDSLWFWYHSLALDSLRSDPRFQSMLKRLNLPTDIQWGPGHRGNAGGLPKGSSEK